MSSIDNKKYHWLKLDKNFFKQHDIEIVEAMPNGKDYILFYLKLLCESISHEGKLRFSETIPYNDEMLATITRTNIDIVRSAIKIFSELKMVELLDDGTLYLIEVEKMIGQETYGARRKRDYRNKVEASNPLKLEYNPNVKEMVEKAICAEKARYIEACGNDLCANMAEDILIEAITSLGIFDWKNNELTNAYSVVINLLTTSNNVFNKTAYVVQILKNMRGLL